MTGLGSLGRLLVAAGALLALVGVLLLVAARLPWLRLGHLPGDISVGKGNFRFYAPLGTALLLSVILSAVFWLCGRR